MGITRRKLPGSARIKKRGDFIRLQSAGSQSGGRKVHGKNFLLIITPAARSNTSRIGITVTKKVAPLANRRNRIKRHIREIFRALRSSLTSNVDLIVIARNGAPECSFAEVQSEVMDALKRGRLL